MDFFKSNCVDVIASVAKQSIVERHPGALRNRSRINSSAIGSIFFAFTLCFLTACDDSASTASSDPVAEVSSSSEVGTVSSSSITDKGSSSRDESMLSSSTNGSSSAKSSSSTDAKSSGGDSSPASSNVKSSSSGTSAGSSAGNSGSSGEEKRPCSEEGKTQRANGVKVICHEGFWVPVSSSSAEPTSSYFDMSNQFNPDVEYGEFTDPRDGQKYRTMELKNGVFMDSYTVFAENLNYGKMIPGGSVQGDSTKYCYDDDPWYCENGWGGLYTWSNAMNLPAVCDSFSVASEKCPNKFNLVHENKKFNGKSYFVQHQGICPEGWHVMNENEWVEIQEKNNTYAMGSKVVGLGNNNSGLSILPAGYWVRNSYDSLIYKHIVEQTIFWLPEQSSDYVDEAKIVNIMTHEMFRGNSRAKSEYAHSIRCVKNY